MLTRWWIPLCLALTTALGCGDSLTKPKTDNPQGPYLAQTTPTNLLANLIRSYTSMDIDGYRALFDTQNYNYIFAPNDLGHDGIPQSWGLADELTSADHLFSKEPNRDGYVCDTIQLAFTIGTPGGTQLNPSWTKITLSQVRLTVDARNKDTQDPLIYEVDGDQAEIYLVQSGPVDSHTSQPTWRIVRWEDRPVVPGAKAGLVKASTWGLVKAIWR